MQDIRLQQVTKKQQMWNGTQVTAIGKRDHATQPEKP